MKDSDLKADNHKRIRSEEPSLSVEPQVKLYTLYNYFPSHDNVTYNIIIIIITLLLYYQLLLIYYFYYANKVKKQKTRGKEAHGTVAGKLKVQRSQTDALHKAYTTLLKAHTTCETAIEKLKVVFFILYALFFNPLIFYLCFFLGTPTCTTHISIYVDTGYQIEKRKKRSENIYHQFRDKCRQFNETAGESRKKLRNKG